MRNTLPTWPPTTKSKVSTDNSRTAFYATGFLDPREPKRLMQRMRRMFARARLEKKEVNILRGFLQRHQVQS